MEIEERAVASGPVKSMVPIVDTLFTLPRHTSPAYLAPLPVIVLRTSCFPVSYP